MNLKQYIKNDYELNGAILGTLMGDMCIIKRDCGNARFQMTHSKEQEQYIKFKCDILNMKSIVKAKISDRATFLKETGKEYIQYQCTSNQNKYATQMYNRVYNGKIKIVNEDILNSITDFGLFLWYLDDGYLNIRYYKDSAKIKEYRMFLYTMNFTLEEVKVIKSWFERRYNISPNINKKQNGYILYFNGSKTREFMKIIEPFYDLVPCLNRKFLKTYFD